MFENESDDDDQVDEDTINIFGFNDDLNQDDKLIVKNLTENQLYNLVERPKYLFTFELKEQEEEFLLTISRRERKSTLKNLIVLVLVNKIIVASETMSRGVQESQ